MHDKYIVKGSGHRNIIADRETAFLEDFPLPRPDMLLLLLFKMRETVVSKNQKFEENMFQHILL